MVQQDYRKARAAAIKELEQLLGLQQKTEQRIIHLRNMITALDQLSDLYSPKKSSELPGLTDAIRSIFTANPGKFFSPTDVRDALIAMGFDDSKYSGFLSSIHVVLRRLSYKREIEDRPGVPGGPGTTYRRKEMEDYLAEL